MQYSNADRQAIAPMRQCSVQAFARYRQTVDRLARTAAVRADHRLHADDEAIRAQSTILG
jgi:hypothetical protein